MDVKPQFIEELKRNAIQAREQYEACTKLLKSYGVALNEDTPKQAPRKTTQPIATPSLGLRASIRAVLQRHPKGATAREIIDELERTGFKVGGSTKLSTRVSVELQGMKAKREVKAANGKYRLS